MSEMDLLRQIEKLKKEEELQLAEMRQKRLLELESKKKETERKNEEDEVKSLSEKEDDLRAKLGEMRRKIFQLKVEASSWENLAKAKTSELRNLERKLNESYEKIWSGREDFCDGVDRFLDGFAPSAKAGASETECAIEDEKELKALKESVAFEENLEKILINRENQLREEKEKLEESNRSERKRLEEWIQITRDRCVELNRRIDQKRKSTDNKNNFRNNQLFSIVNLEDLKKLTQI